MPPSTLKNARHRRAYPKNRIELRKQTYEKPYTTLNQNKTSQYRQAIAFSILRNQQPMP